MISRMVRFKNVLAALAVLIAVVLAAGPARAADKIHLKDGRVRGVLLWNTWGQVDNARSLIGKTGHLVAG